MPLIYFLDTSPLSNWVMHPFWNATVKLFPRWVAPNLLTLLGFLFLVSQTILLWAVDPDYKKGGQIDEIPKWVSQKIPPKKFTPKNFRRKFT